MKFLLKIALLAAAAKFVLNTPDGTAPQLERITDLTKRELSHRVEIVFTKLEDTIRFILS